MTTTTEDRLARLEQSNRRLKAGLLASATLASAAVILGAAAPPPKVYTAEKFVLVDPNGHERAELSANSKAAALQFINTNGTRGITIASSNDAGNGINLSDAKGHERAFLLVESDGDASLAITRDGLEQETFILQDNSGGTAMAIRDSEGKDRVNLGIGPKGAALALSDGNATPRAIISDVTLATYDKGGKMNWGAFPEGMTPEERKRVMDTSNLTRP